MIVTDLLQDSQPPFRKVFSPFGSVLFHIFDGRVQGLIHMHEVRWEQNSFLIAQVSEVFRFRRSPICPQLRVQLQTL